MPIYLKEINKYHDLEKFGSVLIVPCRFCPAASIATIRKEPYIELLRSFLTTASYEQYIEEVRSGLEQKGVKADVFRSHLLHQFVVCMWTSRRRKRLMKRALKYDALLVMACEAGVQTIYDSVNSTSCKVFQGMRSEGIMSIKPLVQLPGNIKLQLNSISPLLHKARDSDPWVHL